MMTGRCFRVLLVLLLVVVGLVSGGCILRQTSTSLLPESERSCDSSALAPAELSPAARAPDAAPAAPTQELSPYQIALQANKRGRELYNRGEYAAALNMFAVAAANGSNDGVRWSEACHRRIKETGTRGQRAASASPPAAARYVGGESAQNGRPMAIQGGTDPAQAARIEARARRMMARDDMRKWRWQHGLPTQAPTTWEKIMGELDGDPW